jgi:hypothetical protein
MHSISIRCEYYFGSSILHFNKIQLTVGGKITKKTLIDYIQNVFKYDKFIINIKTYYFLEDMVIDIENEAVRERNLAYKNNLDRYSGRIKEFRQFRKEIENII